MRPDPLAGFILRTVLWLPACFAAWYWSASWHASLAGYLARHLIGAFHAGLVTAIEQPGTDLVFVTSLVVQPAPGQDALLLPEVNPRLYTYGLPFFAALMLAARASAWKLVAGACALLPFQAWGIAFDLLAQVGMKLGPEVAAKAGVTGWLREAVVLGYQLGTLIFPTLVPVLLWAAFNRPLVAGLVLRRPAAGSPP